MRRAGEALPRGRDGYHAAVVRPTPLPPVLASLLIACCLGGCDGRTWTSGEAAPYGAAPPSSRPHDPDLELGATCPDAPSAEALASALPDYVKELVLLWPRAGRRVEGDRCTAVARLAVVTHQGMLVTLSMELHDRPAPARGYRRLDAPMRRASLDLVPAPEHPLIHAVIDGGPSLDRDLLETALSFMDLGELAGEFAALRGR